MTEPAVESQSCRRPAAWTEALLVWLLLAALGWLAYAPSLDNPFVYDDQVIEQNTQIRELFGARDGVIDGNLTPFRARYVVTASFALNYQLTSLSPRGFRLGNLLLHIACAGLLFHVARRALGDTVAVQAASAIAAAAAVLWMLHPMNGECVFYITQRTEQLMAFFALLTLWFAQRSFDSERPVTWQAAAVLSCLLGVLSKENMAAVPALVLLYDRAWVAGSFREAIRRRWLWYLLLLATILASVIALMQMERSAGIGTGYGVTPWHYLFTQSRVVPWYFTRVLWPFGLSIFHDQPYYTSFWQVWDTMLLMTAVLVCGAWLIWRHGRLGFVVATVLLVLAPTSSVIPIVLEPVADRRMYLPMAAILPALLWGLWQLTVMAPRRRLGQGVWFGLVAAAAGGLMLLTWADAHKYRSKLSTWQYISELYPSAHVAQSYLGSAYLMQDQPDKTLAIAQRLVFEHPRYMYGFFRLAEALRDLDRDEQALLVVREIGRRFGQSPLALAYASRLAGELDDFDLALSLIERAYELQPSQAHQRAWVALLYQSGRPDESLLLLRRQAGIDVDRYDERLAIARDLASEQMFQAALRQARIALELAASPAQRQTAQQLIHELESARINTAPPSP